MEKMPNFQHKITASIFESECRILGSNLVKNEAIKLMTEKIEAVNLYAYTPLKLKEAYKKIHGDWAVIKNETAVELETMNNRIKDMETQMNDTDKDGVPDYLDRENNSVNGVAVDTKGRMIDLNRNGVPDELERYIDKNNKEHAKTGDSVKELLNSGYICVYFESGKDYPTDISTDGIAFVLNYLRNNPLDSMDVIGSSDEIGDTVANELLATRRATNICKILIKSGIDKSRLHIISNGEDKSVDVTSKTARKLVRRVSFKTQN